MAAVHLITFAAPQYATSAEVLRHSALVAGRVDSVRVYTLEDECVQAYYQASGLSLGAGFSVCRPHLIQHALSQVSADDVVVYVDAASVVEADLREALQTELADWTIKLFTSESKVLTSIQVYRKRPRALEFVEQLAASCKDMRGLAAEESTLGELASGYSDTVTLCPDPSLPSADMEPWLNSYTKPLGRIPTITVITPSVGSPHLHDAILSVSRQTLPGVEMWVVIDGPEYAAAVRKIAEPFQPKMRLRILELPENTGKGGWLCHRVYGAVPWLTNSSHVSFLDEDNTMEPNHLELLMEAVHAKGAKWGFSFRRIVDKDGHVVCDDRCESLGFLHHTVCVRGDYLVDTNCYLIERDLAVRASPCFNVRARQKGVREADRELCYQLSSSAPYVAVPHSTINYRLGGNSQSVQKEFFLEGNKKLCLDFSKPALYVFHFNELQTNRYFETRHNTDRSYALDEWQMTLLRGLEKDFNLMNGFANIPTIPPQSTVLAIMCLPKELPLEFLEVRKDLKRVVYTIEGPNIRHSSQWELPFLTKHFDVALTYWAPLLKTRSLELRTVFCPHNTHHLDLDNPLDRAVLRQNTSQGHGVVMVLGWRPLRGKFSVNGVELQCLDPLRGELVSKLRTCTVVGQHWDKYRSNPKLTVVSPAGKPQDPNHSVDWLQQHPFCIIVENVDAEGYVSEKLYDALIAGCIPLYWGNPSRQLLEHIPELKGLYIDIRNMSSSDIQELIDSFSSKAIESFRAKIYATREAVLRKVGVQAFAECVKQAVS